MIFQGGRSFTTIRAQCLGSSRTIVTFSTIERAPGLNVFRSKNDCNSVIAFRRCSPLLSRSYADKPVSRPKAHTGRTSATQKRAPTTSATKAAKKPAPKRTAPKAIPKGKAVSKPKVKSKPRKKAKAKPKPKKRVLTDKQKTSQATKQRTEKVKALKEKALLTAPKNTPSSAWSLFNAEYIKAQGPGTKLSVAVKESAAQFRAITPEQLEHHNHIANQNAASNKVAYVQWVESYTPNQIREANVARRALTKLRVKQGTRRYPQIHDERSVRGFRTAYILFYKSRYDSGDFKGLKVGEAAKLASREWKALSAAEKKPFVDEATKDRQRYTDESKTVYKK